MAYAHNLYPAQLPSFIEFDGHSWDTSLLSAAQLAAQGWLSIVYDPVDALLGYADSPCVEEQRDGGPVAVAYAIATPAEESAAQVEKTRQQKQADIDAQVPDGTARRLIEDPLFEGEIQSYSGGASERKSELEDTPDVDVDAFNTTIVPTPISGDGFVQAKMTVFIDIVDPWAGAPDAIYALRCALRIVTTGHDADGESARAHMYNEAGVDQGVIPFTQDADDPSVWWTQSQVGRYWASPDTGASMRLLWDSGQTAVAETKTLSGYGDRQYAIVRAGLPGR